MGAVKWTGKAITVLSFYKPKLPTQRFDLFVFAVLFALAFGWCVQTAGEPYAQALAQVYQQEVCGMISISIAPTRSHPRTRRC